MSKTNSFSKWQATTISQLSYSINLILSFSVATLGFGISLLLNENFIPVGCQKVLFTSSLFFLLCSIFLGVFVTINRLRDFRATTRIAKQSNNSSDINTLRKDTKVIGKNTWLLFWCQIGTFSLAVLLISITLFCIFKEKLI